MPTTLLFLLTTLACKGDKAGDSTPVTTPTDDSSPSDDSGGTDTGTLACDVEILSVRPVAGTDEAYFHGDIEFTLDEPDPTGVVSLALQLEDKKEVDVPGTQFWSTNGLTAYFTPASPLAPDTSYRSRIAWCGGVQEIPFETSDIGIPVKDPKALLGTTWMIDLRQGRFVEPPAAMHGVLTKYIETKILLAVELADPDWIEIEGVRAWDGGSQDVCFQTADFSAANFTGNPYFSLGPKALTMSVAGAEILIEDLEISGAFDAKGSTLTWVKVTGNWDTRPLDVPMGSDGAACKEAARDGGVCVPCDDGEIYCLPLHVDELVAVPSTEVVESVGADCSHPDCKSAECAKKE